MLDVILASAVTMKPLLDSLSNGVVVVDVDARPILRNPAADRILGGACDNARKRVFGPDRTTPVPMEGLPLARALRGESVDDQELNIEGTDGGQTVVNVTARALRNGVGEIAGAVAVFRDVSEARRTQEALRESERRYRALTAHLPSTAVLLFDREMRFMLVGGGGLASTGLTPEALEGRLVADYASPVLLPPYRAVFEGRETNTEITRADGSTFRVQVVPLRDERQEIFAGMIVAEDVTAQRRDIASRLATETLLRTITESTREAIISMDRSGRVISWNHGAETTFGYSAAEMLGGTLENTLSERSREVLQGVADAAGAAGAAGEGVQEATVELHGLRRDGAEFPIELSLSTWTNPDGRFFTVVLRDVSVRKREELALRASEERFRTLSQSAPVGIFETDARGNCLFVNMRWTALSGMPREFAVGQGWMNALHPNDRAEVSREWSACCEERREFHMEYRFESPGRVVWVAGNAVELRNDQGDVTGYLGTVMDITESKAAEEALRRALHDKEVLLREIHHRVKNNLQVVSSLLQLQARRVTDPQTRAAFVQSQSRVRSIALLHEKLYRTHDLTLVDMDDYLRELTTELGRTYDAAATRALVTTDVRGVSLSIDAAVPCGLIVSELVTNSLKHAFVGAPGHVEVRMRRAGQLVELVVADDGPGLPPDVDPASVSTLGLQLVRALSRQLNATTVFDRDGGTRCTVIFRMALPDEGTMLA